MPSNSTWPNHNHNRFGSVQHPVSHRSSHHSSSPFDHYRSSRGHSGQHQQPSSHDSSNSLHNWYNTSSHYQGHNFSNSRDPRNSSHEWGNVSAPHQEGQRGHQARSRNISSEYSFQSQITPHWSNYPVKAKSNDGISVKLPKQSKFSPEHFRWSGFQGNQRSSYSDYQSKVPQTDYPSSDRHNNWQSSANQSYGAAGNKRSYFRGQVATAAASTTNKTYANRQYLGDAATSAALPALPGQPNYWQSDGRSYFSSSFNQSIPPATFKQVKQVEGDNQPPNQPNHWQSNGNHSFYPSDQSFPEDSLKAALEAASDDQEGEASIRQLATIETSDISKESYPKAHLSSSKQSRRAIPDNLLATGDITGPHDSRDLGYSGTSETGHTADLFTQGLNLASACRNEYQLPHLRDPILGLPITSSNHILDAFIINSSAGL